MEWEAIGADKFTIISSPVSLTNDLFTNTINQYREWKWEGPEPLNKRPNVYLALVEIN